jgi:DNA-binding Xre family transcriptional regulator
MIIYDPFWKTIKEKGVTTYMLTKKLGVSNGTLYRMRKRDNLSTHTINQLCRILDCAVEDIMKYIPDEKTEENKK